MFSRYLVLTVPFRIVKRIPHEQSEYEYITLFMNLYDLQKIQVLLNKIQFAKEENLPYKHFVSDLYKILVASIQRETDIEKFKDYWNSHRLF